MSNASGATIGRYPGGTPSDYWHWDKGTALLRAACGTCSCAWSLTHSSWRCRSGWATDLATQKVYRATPADWGAYAAGAGVEFTIFDTNQLTMNLSYAIKGLKASVPPCHVLTIDQAIECTSNFAAY